MEYSSDYFLNKIQCIYGIANQKSLSVISAVCPIYVPNPKFPHHRGANMKKLTDLLN